MALQMMGVQVRPLAFNPVGAVSGGFVGGLIGGGLGYFAGSYESVGIAQDLGVLPR